MTKVEKNHSTQLPWATLGLRVLCVQIVAVTEVQRRGVNIEVESRIYSHHSCGSVFHMPTRNANGEELCCPALDCIVSYSILVWLTALLF